jgi:histone acetyltransferase (RNA polymerase elongator complex component)
MGKKHYIIPIFVPHKGCPHDCIFCNQKRITGTEGENVDAAFVEKTIDEYLTTISREGAFVEVSFFGGSFTAIPMDYQNQLMGPAQIALEKGKINAIRLSTRPDYINENILDNLKKHGASIIELGVQSLDEKVLIASGRGHSAEDVYKASMLIKEKGFVLGHQLMLGLPLDSEKKDIDSARKSISMKPDICRIYPALVIRNTPMEDLYYRGKYKPYSLEEAVNIAKKVYSLYYASGIPVIRVGLQPTDNINVHGDVVAGPFHPSIRELVEGSLLNDMVYEGLKEEKGIWELYINPRYISRLYADKKRYFNNIKSNLTSAEIKVVSDISVPVEDVYLKQEGKEKRMSLEEYMKKTARCL